MNEKGWLQCDDPDVMLEFLSGISASDRKLRLFECACCRRIWHLIPPYPRRTVEVAERFADGLATVEELDQSYQITRDTPEDYEGDFDPAAEGEDYDPYCVPWPSQATTATAFSPGCWDSLDAAYWSAELAAWTRPKHVHHEERKAQSQLLRDVFGPLPVRPVTISPSILAWNGRTITKLAEQIYQDQAFDCLLFLADPLEEAGCEDQDILNHCRGPGPHVKGCWLVDLLTERE